MKRELSGCSELLVFSEHLGTNMTSGTYKKTKDLSEIISDPRMVSFIMSPQLPGRSMFEQFLKDHAFSIDDGGSITVNVTADGRKNRYVLSNICISSSF